MRPRKLLALPAVTTATAFAAALTAPIAQAASEPLPRAHASAASQHVPSALWYRIELELAWGYHSRGAFDGVTPLGWGGVGHVHQQWTHDQDTLFMVTTDGSVLVRRCNQVDRTRCLPQGGLTVLNGNYRWDLRKSTDFVRVVGDYDLGSWPYDGSRLRFTCAGTSSLRLLYDALPVEGHGFRLTPSDFPGFPYPGPEASAPKAQFQSLMGGSEIYDNATGRPGCVQQDLEAERAAPVYPDFGTDAWEKLTYRPLPIRVRGHFGRQHFVITKRRSVRSHMSIPQEGDFEALTGGGANSPDFAFGTFTLDWTSSVDIKITFDRCPGTSPC
jgi:hypothetical protein